MKRLIFTLTFLLAVVAASKGQNLIARQHGGAPTFYTKLPDAVAAAAAGDTLYIPGGTFDAVFINKKLYIIGVGYNPDSTKATGRTFIPSVTIGASADGGSLIGVNTFNLTTDGNSVSNYSISRCKINSISLSVSANTFNNGAINQNIIGTLVVTGTVNAIDDNVFTGQVFVYDSATAYYSLIRNNLFLFSTGTPLIAQHCIVENNLFEITDGSRRVDGEQSFFYNNLVLYTYITGNGNQFSGNFQDNLPLSTVFVNYDSSNISDDNIYKQDFHLKSNSSYKNAGADGTDLGIYGGAFPWKDGSIPSNPHIQNINIAPQTDASGNLKIQITVAAQNN